MANWIIKLPVESELATPVEYTSQTVTLGMYSAVATVLGIPSAQWDQLHPYLGPDQLAAWLAVCAADSGSNKNVQEQLESILRMPVARMINCLTIVD